jgi:acyl-CoA thioester hydrolase
MLYRVEAADGRLVALGKTVQVMYDYEAARTIPVPEELRERVRAFQGDWRAP